MSLGKPQDERSVDTVLTESLEDAGAEPEPQSASSQDGKSGKLLPPGGKNAQPLDLGPDAGATDHREWAESGEGTEANFDQSATASVAAAMTGRSTEASQSRQSAPGSETQQKAASADHLVTVAAGTPRNAGTSNSSAAEASLNTISVDSLDGPPMSGRNISERALKAPAEPGLQASSGDAVNPLVSGGGGLFADLSAEASPLSERGQAAAGAELRPGDRLLTDRPGGELTPGDRAPRLAVQQFAGQPGWGEEIQGKLQWLSRQGIHRAELQLHPAELGSIEVRITAEQDQTSVVFVAANRTARELLEAEIPRLRELFSQAGVELGQAEVSDRESGDREFAAREESHDERHSSTTRNGAEPAETPMDEANLLSVGVQGSRGLIDYYI